MASFHSQMELLYEDEYQWLWRNHHICHYHVNDYAGGYKDTFTVEATAFDSSGVIDIEMLNRQFEFIRKAIA